MTRLIQSVNSGLVPLRFNQQITNLLSLIPPHGHLLGSPGAITRLLPGHQVPRNSLAGGLGTMRSKVKSLLRVKVSGVIDQFTFSGIVDVEIDRALNI